MISFSRIAILDPALWIIFYPTYWIFIGVSNKFCDVLADEQCNHHEVSLHLGCYRMGSGGVKKTACLSSLVILFSSQNLVHFPKLDREFHEIHL